MKAFTRLVNGVLAASLLLTSCQTMDSIEKLASSEGATGVAADGSTSADQAQFGVMNSIELSSPSAGTFDEIPGRYLIFHLTFDQPRFIESWLVEWAAQDGTIVYTAGGTPPNLPETLLWDGRNRIGQKVAPGVYEARLTVDYGKALGQKATRSVPFSLLADDSDALAISHRDEGDDPELINGLPFDRLE